MKYILLILILSLLTLQSHPQTKVKIGKSTEIGKPDNEKLKFYGFDCQSFKGPANALTDYVKEFDKQNLNEFLKGLSILNDSSYRYLYPLKPGKSSL